MLCRSPGDIRPKANKARRRSVFHDSSTRTGRMKRITTYYFMLGDMLCYTLGSGTLGSGTLIKDEIDRISSSVLFFDAVEVNGLCSFIC